MPDWQLYSNLNSILAISGHLEGNTEILFAVEPHLRLESVSSPAGLEPVTARSAGLALNLRVTGALFICTKCV